MVEYGSADSWPVRCRLVRDVAVGLYQCRAAGATHISWGLPQLFLDTQGRVQILPGLSETAIAESDDVFALGRLLWCVISRSLTPVKDWEQGKGLSRDCPPTVIALIQACTDPVVGASLFKSDSEGAEMSSGSEPSKDYRTPCWHCHR